MWEPTASSSCWWDRKPWWGDWNRSLLASYLPPRVIASPLFGRKWGEAGTIRYHQFHHLHFSNEEAEVWKRKNANSTEGPPGCSSGLHSGALPTSLLRDPAGPSPPVMLHVTNRGSMEPVPAGSSSESLRWLTSSPSTKRIDRKQEEKEYSRRTYIEKQIPWWSLTLLPISSSLWCQRYSYRNTGLIMCIDTNGNTLYTSIRPIFFSSQFVLGIFPSQGIVTCYIAWFSLYLNSYLFKYNL